MENGEALPMRTEKEIRDWLSRHQDTPPGQLTDLGRGVMLGYVDALRWVLGTSKQSSSRVQWPSGIIDTDYFHRIPEPPPEIEPMEEWWQAWDKKRSQQWKDYLFHGKPIKIKGVMYTVKGTLDNEYWGARGV